MEELTSELVSVGQQLSEFQINDRLDLRMLGRVIDNILSPLLSKKTDVNLRCFAFFFITFFDDVRYNLMGDFPYGEEVDILRKTFFKTIGPYLTNIGQSLSNNSFANVWNNFALIVSKYLDTVEQINELVENNTRRT